MDQKVVQAFKAGAVRGGGLLGVHHQRRAFVGQGLQYFCFQGPGWLGPKDPFELRLFFQRGAFWKGLDENQAYGGKGHQGAQGPDESQGHSDHPGCPRHDHQQFGQGPPHFERSGPSDGHQRIQIEVQFQTTVWHDHIPVLDPGTAPTGQDPYHAQWSFLKGYCPYDRVQECHSLFQGLQGQIRTLPQGHKGINPLISSF